MVALSIVYGVAYLIYRINLIYIVGLDYVVGLDYEDFSSLPYGVTYSNIVRDALPPNLVHVPPLGYIIWLSYPPTLKYLLVR